ncbi:helix-turn-helix domain-containing protein [Oerskovia sp. Sa1BUA8]|uniref:Helix-turn-helix domain-containing protein n=1 Tax=Oerskovia douganii TaxID=2762210 RepID=A0A9D5YYV8_9CELL|nr:helix-turn-helix domain-containing protein [Oerskovia douganii]MBE7700297.1 helix-turn-helix domain-containing protein [Oerskovia douganii]
MENTQAVGRAERAAPPRPGFGPPLVRRAVRPARLSKARLAVLDVLASQPEPCSVSSVATALDQHTNTVREHLEGLVETGLATSESAPAHGRGRPARLYAAVTESPTTAGAAEYAGLASALAAQIARSSADPVGDALAAGRAWGAELVGDVEILSGPGTVPDGVAHPANVGGTRSDEGAPGARRGPSGGPDVVGHPGSAGDGSRVQEKKTPGRGDDNVASAARHEVVDLLDRLGFAPQADDDAASVALTRCPLLEAAYRNPEVVCAVHLGLAQGALERLGAPREGTSLLPFAEPGACRLHLRPADGPPEGAPDWPTPEAEATSTPGPSDGHR